MAFTVKPSYYTTKKQALGSGGPDEPGLGLRFAAGKGYYLGAAGSAGPRPSALAAAASAPADPYASILASEPAPYTPQQISQQVNGLPAPLTAAQIKAQGQGQVSDMLAPIIAAITARTNAATHAIGGYAGDLQGKLGQTDWGAPYAGGEQQQAAVDAALQASLNNAGSSDAAGLASRLAVLNDPSVAEAASGVAANGAANAGTQVAQGSSALSNLIAQAAASKAYGQELPGIAGLAGVQQIAGNEQNGVNQVATQTSQVEQQLPAILQNLAAESDNRSQARTQLEQALTSTNDSRANNITGVRQNQLARNDAISTTAANNQTKVTTATIAANQREYVASQKAAAAGDAAAKKAKAPSASLTRANGYLTSNDGTPIKSSGKLRPIAGYKLNATGDGVVSTKTAKTPRLSALQVQNYKASAASIAENAYKGFKPPATKADPDPKFKPPISYTEALDHARTQGIPDSISIPNLNRWYKVPGARGRPQTKAQKAADDAALAAANRVNWPANGAPMVLPWP